jgi:hypothetical protein
MRCMDVPFKGRNHREKVVRRGNQRRESARDISVDFGVQQKGRQDS